MEEFLGIKCRRSLVASALVVILGPIACGSGMEVGGNSGTGGATSGSSNAGGAGSSGSTTGGLGAGGIATNGGSWNPSISTVIGGAETTGSPVRSGGTGIGGDATSTGGTISTGSGTAAAGECLLLYNDALVAGDACCYRMGGTNICDSSIACNELSGPDCCIIYASENTSGGQRCCLYESGKYGDDASECQQLLSQSRGTR
jgi:hypothetical protein